MISAYKKLKFPDHFSPLQIETSCLRATLMGKFLGNTPGPYHHFKKICSTVWPKLEWHDWLDWRVKNFCEYRVNNWTGCSSAGKTFDAGLLAMTYYLCDPLNTSVILTSTTAKMVRKRIWPVIRKLYFDCQNFPGNLVDSKTTLQAVDGDDKHGIFAIAIQQGSTQKAAADIQGIHSPRMMIVIDEATDTPEAIYEVIPNLRGGTLDFRIIIIGNANSRLDPHGLCCEPKDGWPSVGVEDEEWDTGGVPKWDIESGICLHFDALKSPNIKAGKKKFKFLIDGDDVERAKKSSGGEDTIWFWKYRRGFWAPDGICKTVFSDNLIVQHDGRGKHTFISKSTKVAFLDPSFGGGDKCILQFATIGDLPGGRDGIQIEDTVEIALKAVSKDHVHYQIADRVILECNHRGVTPDHFGLDATGEGGGLASIIIRRWGSDKIIWTEFGGKPSDIPVSEEDRRPATDVYDRRVSELWFSVRNFLINQQLKGLSVIQCRQFCSREFNDLKSKIVLDKKSDCKKKTGRSPDEADAVAGIAELCRRLGVKAGENRTTATDHEWDKLIETTQAVYQNSNYERESIQE